MKLFKLLTLLSVATGSFFITSCGCNTGEEAVPPLRPLPYFKPIVPTETMEVDYSK